MSNALDDLRQTLADVAHGVAIGDQEGYLLNSPAVADAIIAALPGLVKPLEWEPIQGAKGLSGRSGPSSYYVMPCFNNEWRIYGISGDYDGAAQVSTLEAAKAAAQAHHVAQIMAAFGIGEDSQ